jgi:hypothetical protein
VQITVVRELLVLAVIIGSLVGVMWVLAVTRGSPR